MPMQQPCWLLAAQLLAAGAAAQLLLLLDAAAAVASSQQQQQHAYRFMDAGSFTTCRFHVIPECTRVVCALSLIHLEVVCELSLDTVPPHCNVSVLCQFGSA